MATSEADELTSDCKQPVLAVIVLIALAICSSLAFKFPSAWDYLYAAFFVGNCIKVVLMLAMLVPLVAARHPLATTLRSLAWRGFNVDERGACNIMADGELVDRYSDNIFRKIGRRWFDVEEHPLMPGYNEADLEHLCAVHPLDTLGDCLSVLPSNSPQHATKCELFVHSPYPRINTGDGRL